MYETHLDEAAFFWGQWEQELTAPDEVLAEVAESEERLLARLDALVLGGERVAERILRPALASDEPERLSAAVFALLSGGWRWGPDVVLELLGEAGPEALGAIQRALELLDTDALPAWLPSLLSRGELPLQALALDVLGTHGVTLGVPLAGLVTGEPSVAAAALRAAARLRVRLDWPPLRQALASPEAPVRDAALVAALQSGHREAWTVCREQVAARGPKLGLPLLLLSLGAGPSAASLLREPLQEPRLRPDALWALGFNGHVSAAEACLEYLADEEVGHLAAEAFCAITGLVLAGRFVSGSGAPEPDEDAPPKPGGHPAPGPGLPQPDPGAIRAWWEARRRLDPTVRYLRGEPRTPASLLQGLWTEPMRRRPALALEVALRSHGAFQLRPRAFARHQLAALEAMRSAPPPLTSRALAEGLLS
ncbi:TIGR02270 family protein [Archangium violaceum]|uniref:TIGR02270 family protein n=1 Tax=Archangium violaceum TaxID=83451 RepID=UPI002B2B010C|nr:TIGR02270 family protein [Archangium violaceum]